MKNSQSTTSLGGLPSWQGQRRRSSAGAVAHLAKFGMFRDTTISGATRKQQLIIQRERLERKKYEEAKQRLEKEVQMEQQLMEVALKKKRRREEREQRKRMQILYNQAANTIQFHWFAYIDRCEYKQECATQFACTTIQCVWRRYRAIQQKLFIRRAKRNEAAKLIQCQIRRLIQNRKDSKFREDRAQKIISKTIRKYLSSKRSKELKIHLSALKIQSHARVLSARKRANRKKKVRTKKMNRCQMLQEDKRIPASKFSVKLKNNNQGSKAGFFLTESIDAWGDKEESTSQNAVRSYSDTWQKEGRHNDLVHSTTAVVHKEDKDEDVVILNKSHERVQRTTLRKLIGEQIRKKRIEKHKLDAMKLKQQEEQKRKIELAKEIERRRVRRIRMIAQKRKAAEAASREAKQIAEKEKQKADEIAKAKVNAARAKEMAVVREQIKKALEKKRIKRGLKLKEELKAKETETRRLEKAKHDFEIKDKARLEKVRQDATIREQKEREEQERKRDEEEKINQEKKFVEDAQLALQKQKEYEQRQRQLKREARRKAKQLKEKKREKEELERHKSEMQAKAMKLLEDTKIRLRKKSGELQNRISFRTPSGKLNYITNSGLTGSLKPSNKKGRRFESRHRRHSVDGDVSLLSSMSFRSTQSAKSNESRESASSSARHKLDASKALLLPRLSKNQLSSTSLSTSGTVKEPSVQVSQVPDRARVFTPSHPLSFLSEYHKRSTQQHARSRVRSRAIKLSRKRRRKRLDTPSNAKGNVIHSTLLQRALDWKRSQEISNAQDYTYSSSDESVHQGGQSEVTESATVNRTAVTVDPEDSYSSGEFEDAEEGGNNQEAVDGIAALEQDCAARTIQLAFFEHQQSK